MDTTKKKKILAKNIAILKELILNSKMYEKDQDFIQNLLENMISEKYVTFFTFILVHAIQQVLRNLHSNVLFECWINTEQTF